MRRQEMKRLIRAALATILLGLTIGFIPQANAGVVGPGITDDMGFLSHQTPAAVYYPMQTDYDSRVDAIDVDADGNVYSAGWWAGNGDLGAGTFSDVHSKYSKRQRGTSVELGAAR